LQRRRLYLADVKGLNHVLANTDLYRKPEAVSYSLSRLVGDGVLVVEGEKHRRQVRSFPHKRAWFNDISAQSDGTLLADAPYIFQRCC